MEDVTPCELGGDWIGGDMRYLSLRGCTVDLATGKVSGGRQERLTTRELTLLVHLVGASGTVPRETLLTEAFGYAKSATSRAVDKAMNSLRAKIEVDRSAPDHLVTDVGRGYRFVPLGSEVPPERPSAASLEGAARPALAPLPLELDAFVGRAAALDQIRAMLGWSSEPEPPGPTLVTLLGVGGIGKTRLALQLARERPGQTRLLELAGARTREDILRTAGASLGLPLIAPGVEAAEQVGHALAALGPVLVVLDNLEHLRAHVDLVDLWMRIAPRARLLATSREALGLAAERVFLVEPLSAEESIRLLAERAGQRGLALEDDAVLAELARQLDGLPLAIELAAARLGAIGASGLLERLGQRLTLLHNRNPSAPARHTSLAAMVDWSWSLLDGAERTALAELSVFPADFSAEAAEAVLQPPADGRSTLEVLDRLLDASLLTRSAVSGSVRLGMLETLRVYAAERLAALDASVRERAMAAHARYYARLGSELRQGRGPGGAERIRRLTREMDHLVSACRFAIAAREGALALETLEAIRILVTGRGPRDLLRSLAEQVNALPTLTARERAQASLILAGVLKLLEARPMLERAIAEALELGEDALAERARYRLGAVLQDLGQIAAARELFEKGAQSTDPCLRAEYKCRLAGLSQAEGAFHQAASLYAQAEVDARLGGDLFGAGLALHGAVWSAIRLNQLDEAERMLKDCEQIFRDFEQSIGLLHTHATLGQILARRGERERALEMMREAALGFRALGDRKSLMVLAAELAAELLNIQRVDEALTWMAEAETLARALGDVRVLGGLCMLQSQVLMERGEFEAAIALLRASLEELSVPSPNAVSLAVALTLAQSLVKAARPREALAVLDGLERELAKKGLGPTSEMGEAVTACRASAEEMLRA